MFFKCQYGGRSYLLQFNVAALISKIVNVIILMHGKLAHRHVAVGIVTIALCNFSTFPLGIRTEG